MNHCIDCGKPVTRGRTTADHDVTRCLVCQVEKEMKDWNYQTPVMKLRRLAMEKQR